MENLFCALRANAWSGQVDLSLHMNFYESHRISRTTLRWWHGSNVAVFRTPLVISALTIYGTSTFAMFLLSQNRRAALFAYFFFDLLQHKMHEHWYGCRWHEGSIEKRLVELFFSRMRHAACFCAIFALPPLPLQMNMNMFCYSYEIVEFIIITISSNFTLEQFIYALEWA